MRRSVLIAFVFLAAGGAAGYYFVAEPRLKLSRPAYRVDLTEADVKLDGKFVHPIINGEVPEKARSQGASYPLFHHANELVDAKKLRPDALSVVEFQAVPKSSFRVIRRLLLALQQVEVVRVDFLEKDNECGGPIAVSLPILISSASKKHKKSKGNLLQIRPGEKTFSAGVLPWPDQFEFGSSKNAPLVPKPEVFDYSQRSLNEFVERANAWARGKGVLQIGMTAESLDVTWSKARAILCTLRKRTDLGPLLAPPGLVDRLTTGKPKLRHVAPYSAVGDHGVVLWDVFL